MITVELKAYLKKHEKKYIPMVTDLNNSMASAEGLWEKLLRVRKYGNFKIQCSSTASSILLCFCLVPWEMLSSKGEKQ